MMMGADYYQTEAERFSELSDGKVPVGVGENTIIRLYFMYSCIKYELGCTGIMHIPLTWSFVIQELYH